MPTRVKLLESSVFCCHFGCYAVEPNYVIPRFCWKLAPMLSTDSEQTVFKIKCRSFHLVLLLEPSGPSSLCSFNREVSKEHANVLLFGLWQTVLSFNCKKRNTFTFIFLHSSLSRSEWVSHRMAIHWHIFIFGVHPVPLRPSCSSIPLPVNSLCDVDRYSHSK